MAKIPKLTGMSVAELEALIAQAESAKADAEARETKRRELLEEFKRLAGEAGMTPEEVLGVRRRQPRATTAPRKRAPAKVKFRDPKSGKTWSGRGRRPKWVTEKMRV